MTRRWRNSGRVSIWGAAVFGVFLLAANFAAAQTPSPALLVLEKSDNSQAIVDPANLQIVARVPAGPDPHEIVASADGKLAYISNYGGSDSALNTISVIDLAARRTLPPINLGALREPRERRKLQTDPRSLEEGGQPHLSYLPLIRQAVAPADYEFLAKRASREVQRRVHRERAGVALAYLAAVREDFERLLRMARVIAVLSPEVAAVQEFERLRLTVKFAWRYHMLRWKLLAGLAPTAQLDRLSDLVSGLSVRMEAAMKELGERAAVAVELASSMNRRGLDVV